MDPFIKKFLIALTIIVVIIVGIGIWASGRQEDTVSRDSLIIYHRFN